MHSHIKQLHCGCATTWSLLKPRQNPAQLTASRATDCSPSHQPDSRVFRVAAAASRHHLDLRIFSRESGLWSYAGLCSALQPRGKLNEVVYPCVVAAMRCVTFAARDRHFSWTKCFKYTPTLPPTAATLSFLLQTSSFVQQMFHPQTSSAACPSKSPRLHS